MSDDEGVLSVPKKQKIIHYGSLEATEKSSAGDKGSSTNSAIEAGKEAGHINITDGKS